MVSDVGVRKCQSPTSDCLLEESKRNSLVFFTPSQPKDFFLHPVNRRGKKRIFLHPVNYSGKELIFFFTSSQL